MSRPAPAPGLDPAAGLERAVFDFDPHLVQSLVLHGARRPLAQHLMLRLSDPQRSAELLERLYQQMLAQARGQGAEPDCQLSVGLSFRGLQRCGLPAAYQRLFEILAPAFAQGAPVRALRQLGDRQDSAPARWDPLFELDQAHLLISLHGPAAQVASADWTAWLAQREIKHGLLPLGRKLGAPPGEQGQWVHFGMRDELSQPAVQLPGAAPSAGAESLGEFVTGFANSAGFNPFALPLAPAAVRHFFAHGSFAALRQIEQRVAAFEAWVEAQAASLPGALRGRTDWVKAKLLGRWPNGAPLEIGATAAPAPAADPGAPRFDRDPEGSACPFGSHIRRLNPRLDGAVAHARRRPLLRRGCPYGPAQWLGASDEPRGLHGLFFCASLEDQFEHLLGQWADRIALGSADRGSAKDPLIGHHHAADAEYLVPMPEGIPLRWSDWTPFVRTVGTSYLFYPGLEALFMLARQRYAKEQRPWLPHPV